MSAEKERHVRAPRVHNTHPPWVACKSLWCCQHGGIVLPPQSPFAPKRRHPALR